MRFHLLVCEAATGIVLMHNCTTRFQDHAGAGKLPYIEVDSLDATQHRVTGILIMYPKVEVSIYDKQHNHIKTLPT